MNKAEKAAESEFVAKHLEKVKEKMREAMIELHIKRNLEMLRPSIQYFLESGTVSGHFYLSLLQMMNPAVFYPSQPTPEAVAVAFGEWIAKKGYDAKLIAIDPHWTRGQFDRMVKTSELFTLFTHSPEYKALNK